MHVTDPLDSAQNNGVDQRLSVKTNLQPQLVRVLSKNQTISRYLTDVCAAWTCDRRPSDMALKSQHYERC